MQLPNQVWDDVINQASKNVDVLKDQEAVKQLGSILKTNVRAARAIGHPFVSQLGRIYLDMLNVYKVMSENISVAIGVNGEAVTRQPLIKGMRVVKKETLKLISCWVEKSQDENTVLKDFIPPLLHAVLLDYQRCNVPAAREPEVLSTMATIVATLKHSITPEIPKIFDAVFGCTLEMINKDFEEFPEHRTNFYTLLEASNDYCFPAFLTIPQPQFKLILDSIVWAFKHTMRDVAEIGLGVLLQLLKTVSSQSEAAQGFYQTYYTTVLHHLLTVVTDTSHTSGLTMHATILAFMFSLVETKRVKVDLNPDNAGKLSDMSQEAIAARNMIYVQEFIANILKTAFPHLTQNQVKITVQGFFSLYQDVPAFKDHLRDFLVQIKQSLGEDDSDLFLEDKEASMKAAQEAKHKIQSSVPGILNPHEIAEEMEEM
jgi:exportin-1